MRRNGSDVAVFAYDGFGRRVSKVAGGVTRLYQWDDQDVVAERDASGNIVAEYVYYPGVDHPNSVTTGGSTFVVATEPPGNVTGLMSPSGGVTSEYRYKPFGNLERNDQNTANSLRFQARPYDTETGLYYFRARYYDPELGRFISEDPIGLAGGINQYAFAGNDPVNNTDPSGLHSAYRPYDCGNGSSEQLVVDIGNNEVSSSCVYGGGGMSFTGNSGYGDFGGSDAGGGQNGGQSGMGSYGGGAGGGGAGGQQASTDKPPTQREKACIEATLGLVGQSAIDALTAISLLSGLGEVYVGYRAAASAVGIAARVNASYAVSAGWQTVFRGVLLGYAGHAAIDAGSATAIITAPTLYEAFGRVTPGFATYYKYQDRKKACAP